MKTLTILISKIKIIRVDFNVPLDENLNVTDATQLKRQNHNRCYFSSRWKRNFDVLWGTKGC
jgi:3-phosphoglycerate kinase